MSFKDEVADQLNLRWAWEKVRREATPGDVWFDQVELAGFELELERNLQGIAGEFRRGRYRLTPLKPLPFPKHPDKEGNPRVRQVFHVSVRDQVAWTAVVNLVGPHVDSKMPAWSYGNRLFRSIWVEQDKDGVRRRKIGRYRHAAGHLYLPFGQSWPVFRRHVYLATRAMTKMDKSERLDERTEEELSLQEQLAEEYRCPFVMPAYWQDRRSKKPVQELYWCSIDLEKFYPRLRLSVVMENIVEQLPPNWRDDATRLFESMLHFRLELGEWTTDELQKMDLFPNRKTYSHIPTGLYVAGFLANVGLLKVDLQVVECLHERNVAHFRFVDDHIVIAYSFKELMQWVQEYADLLRDSGTGARVNREKVEPEELAGLFTRVKRKRSSEKHNTESMKAETACRLDPQFPSPLMTKTLALVSGIARTDFNLLESQELAALTDQLEHLLLVDLPNDEMPEKTRLSFAATRLTRIAECRLANAQPRAALRCRQETLRVELENQKLADERHQEIDQELKEIKKKLDEEESRLKSEVDRAFQLLRKVLRERPDRVRLWTRAVLMCRLTGVKGMTDLLADIRRECEKNSLAGEYLYANMLVLLGAQALVAARILRDEGVAHWRKQASRAFLDDIRATKIEAPKKENGRWFLHMSWHLYCFGLHCADLVLKDETIRGELSLNVSLPEERLELIALSRSLGECGS